MADIEMEEQHLVLANQHILQAEQNITKQQSLINQLETAGHDAVEAKELLVVFMDTLRNMHDHREQILLALDAANASL